VVLKLTCTGGAFALEAVDVDFQPMPLIPTRRLPALTPGAICQPPLTPPAGPGDNTGGGPGPGSPPDPMTCTACADWMAANTTGTVGGQPAYRLAGMSTFAGCQTELALALPTLLAANICGLGSDPNVYITQSLGHSTPADGVQAASAFLALNPDDYLPTDNKTWEVFFRCADNP
jgi:hypothetical protein